MAASAPCAIRPGLAVYVHVTVPCELGHPERVAAGVLWPFPVGKVHAPTDFEGRNET